MGNITPSPEAHLDRQISSKIAKSVVKSNKVIRLLFLGTAEAGKSTLMKQLRNTVGKEENVLTPAESTIRRLCVFQTVLSNMVELLKASDQYEPLADENLAKAKEYIISQFGNKRGVVRDFSFMNDNIKDMLIALWNDEGIRATWELYRSKIQVQESLEYFMNEAERVLKEDSEITKLDWLHVRIRTTGMVVENFKVKEASFTAIEVGGARVERKKWIHVFQNVTAVVYVCAISEYDEFLFEDRSMNRMVESLNLFEEMVNHEDLSKSGMILYMNKADIFKRKIAHIPIKHVDLNDPSENRWEDYNGPNAVGYDPDSPEFFEAYEASTQYFIDKFCALKKNSTKDIYVQVICAMTDAQKFVETLRSACLDIILRSALNEQGFLRD